MSIEAAHAARLRKAKAKEKALRKRIEKFSSRFSDEEARIINYIHEQLDLGREEPVLNQRRIEILRSAERKVRD